MVAETFGTINFFRLVRTLCIHVYLYSWWSVTYYCLSECYEPLASSPDFPLLVVDSRKPGNQANEPQYSVTGRQILSRS